MRNNLFIFLQKEVLISESVNVIFIFSSKRMNMFKSPNESPSKKQKEDTSMEDSEQMAQQEAPLVSAPPVGTVAPVVPNDIEMSHMEVQQDQDLGSSADSPTKGPKVDIMKWTVSNIMQFILTKYFFIFNFFGTDGTSNSHYLSS